MSFHAGITHLLVPSAVDTVNVPVQGRMMSVMYLIQGLPSMVRSGQKALLILRSTSAALSSMKIAELGSLFDIFSWPCRRTIVLKVR